MFILGTMFQAGCFVFARQRNRSHFDIIATLLETTKDGALLSQIIDEANVSFRQFKRYTDALLDMGFMGVETVNGRKLYTATPKGLEYLNHYYTLRRMLLTR